MGKIIALDRTSDQININEYKSYTNTMICDDSTTIADIKAWFLKNHPGEDNNMHIELSESN